MTTGTYVRLAGGVLGVIVAIVFVKQHPVPIILEVIAAGLWFAGDYMRKIGQ